ncbi:hypothetical protein GCM10009574_092180 [Streptomyces asiaticus]|uniref:Uncharacterized protein n=2 Tax=Streptomyces rhizosphaericus TaxID=114699 RepID=A0ABN1R9V6_9ACTN
MRKQVPLAAGTALVEERVDDLPHLVPALVNADRAVCGLPCGDHRLDKRPLLVRQVGLVGLALAHGVQHGTPEPADRPGYRAATHAGDGKSAMHLHTALSGVLPFEVGDAVGGWLAVQCRVAAVVIVGVRPFAERLASFVCLEAAAAGWVVCQRTERSE